jgi:hypothetical protein
MNRNLLTVLGLLGLVCLNASPAAAYIGPGVGAGAMAAVFGVIGSVILAIVGVVYYPVKRWLKGRKGAARGKRQDDVI